MLCSLLQGHLVTAYQKENQKQLYYPNPRQPKSSLCSFYICHQIIPKMSHYYPWIVGTTYFPLKKNEYWCYFAFTPSSPTIGASLMAQMVKKLPAMWEMQVWSLGQEDLLEEGMVTHSSILAWRIPWTVEPEQLNTFANYIKFNTIIVHFYSFSRSGWDRRVFSN